MPAYLKYAPAGFPGDISRSDETNVENGTLVALSTVFAPRYGEAMRYVAGGLQQWTTGLTKADFAGAGPVREIPGIAGSVASDADIDTGGAPNPDQQAGMVVRGYMLVKCTAGTPARGGVVYVRIVSATDRPIGAFEAASDAGNSVALDAVQAEWASDGVDANGVAEIRIAR